MYIRLWMNIYWYVMHVSHSNNIPSKPARYDTARFCALVGLKFDFTFNLETYVVTHPEGPQKYNNSGEKLSLD